MEKHILVVCLLLGSASAQCFGGTCAGGVSSDNRLHGHGSSDGYGGSSTLRPNTHGSSGGFGGISTLRPNLHGSSVNHQGHGSSGGFGGISTVGPHHHGSSGGHGGGSIIGHHGSSGFDIVQHGSNQNRGVFGNNNGVSAGRYGETGHSGFGGGQQGTGGGNILPGFDIRGTPNHNNHNQGIIGDSGQSSYTFYPNQAFPGISIDNTNRGSYGTGHSSNNIQRNPIPNQGGYSQGNQIRTTNNDIGRPSQNIFIPTSGVVPNNNIGMYGSDNSGFNVGNGYAPNFIPGSGHTMMFLPGSGFVRVNVDPRDTPQGNGFFAGNGINNGGFLPGGGVFGFPSGDTGGYDVGVNTIDGGYLPPNTFTVNNPGGFPFIDTNNNFPNPNTGTFFGNNGGNVFTSQNPVGFPGNAYDTPVVFAGSAHNNPVGFPGGNSFGFGSGTTTGGFVNNVPVIQSSYLPPAGK